VKPKPEELPQHTFETQLVDEAASGTGDRLPYEQLMIERENLLRQSYIQVSDNAKNPILYFNQRRQLLHANAAALAELARRPINECVGLRLGEIFGCDHKMRSNADEVYVCQDCNFMPALRAALQGRHSVETQHLIMHPLDKSVHAVYKISSIPVSAGDDHLAMMIFEKVDDTHAR
jgi:hypothetical protein